MLIQSVPVEYALPVSLRLRLGLRRILDSVLRFATWGEDEMAAAERLFMAVLARENANINRICFSYATSVSEFDDLRQDALVNIWRGLKTFRGDASERTWVYRVTINSCLSTIRKQNRHKHESLEQLYSLIDAENYDRDVIEQLHSIISRLGREDKAIIMMWLDEMPYEEIAQTMGMNRNSVATRIRRIKEKITKQYQKEELL